MNIEKLYENYKMYFFYENIYKIAFSKVYGWEIEYLTYKKEVMISHPSYVKNNVSFLIINIKLL